MLVNKNVLSSLRHESAPSKTLRWSDDGTPQVVIVVDEIMWTGYLGASILRRQQAGSYPVADETLLAMNTLEKMPEEGNVAGDGPPQEAVSTFLEYSLEQIEAMIDLVRGELDRCAGDGTPFVVRPSSTAAQNKKHFPPSPCLVKPPLLYKTHTRSPGGGNGDDT